MANQEHVDILKRGTAAWNEWRKLGPRELREVDLSGADLSMLDLSEALLINANLRGADLSGSRLIMTPFHGAQMSGAILGAKFDLASFMQADLSNARICGEGIEASFYFTRLDGADLSRSNLTGSKFHQCSIQRANMTQSWLHRASFMDCDFTDANLTGAELTACTLIGCNLQGARITESRVYGMAAWDLYGQPAEQSDLIITLPDEPVVTVDSLKVAQFLYTLLSNQEGREILDTITSKVVLILGRFSEERKPVLDTLRTVLREHGYVPVLFDFDKPESRNFTETVSTLAHMARFIIADISDPRSIPQELTRTIPILPSVPVQPIIEAGQEPWGMFLDHLDYPWVLSPHTYRGVDDLIAKLESHVIAPAEAVLKTRRTLAV